MCICFTLNGRRICICIPLLIEWPWRKPKPDPRYIENERITKTIEYDLRAVGTLHAVASGLSGDLRRPIQAALDDAMKTLQSKMPEGVTLRLHDVEKR